MQLKDIEPILKKTVKTLEKLETSLILAGICPYCGEHIEPKDQENGKVWVCKCRHLTTWMSNKNIARIKGDKVNPIETA